jgi:iron only hydrogenase large subunit-like protein
MKTFHELFLEILQQEASQGRRLIEEFTLYDMDCLLHPEKVSPVEQEIITFSEEQRGKLAGNLDVSAVLDCVCDEGVDVYALVAPAFAGQFEGLVSPGKLRTACKAIGFKGMIEVALFADILTLKEALEFDKNIKGLSDFQLTSCCCPVWISLIRKEFKDMLSHLPGSVSPMIAAGRVVKKVHPNGVTVFVGPCMAKKNEAKEADLVGAVDYVLTFQEFRDILDMAGLSLEELPMNEREHSSRAGRIYASTGGVSEAVRRTVEQLHPGREIPLNAKQADGIPSCRELIGGIKKGELKANFYEGMACNGGCAGGPLTLIDKEQGKEAVREYGDLAFYQTPLENPYVMEFLSRLGFGTVEDLLAESELFTRKFA